MMWWWWIPVRATRHVIWPARQALVSFSSNGTDNFLKRGFLDGRAGFMFCRLLATYEMLNVYKARELRLHAAQRLKR